MVLIKIPLVNLAIYNFLYPLWCGFLIVLNFNRQQILRHIKPLLLLLLLFTWSGISLLFSDYKITVLIQIIKYTNYGIVFLALLLATSDRSTHQGYYQVIIHFLSLVGCLGIIEYFYPKLSLLVILRENTFYPRVSSVMQNPNPFGVLMAIASIITILSYQQSHLKRTDKLIYFILQEIIFVLAVSCSGSRNAWLILIIGFSLLISYKIINFKSIAWILILLILGIFLIPVSHYRLGLADLPNITSLPFIHLSSEGLALQLPSPQNTAFSRIFLWKRAINEIIQRPIFGLGLGVFNLHISQQVFGKAGFTTHNLFLESLVDLGLPGFLIVVVGIRQLWRQLIYCDCFVNIALSLFLISQLIDLFLHDFTFTTIAILFMAIALNSSRREKTLNRKNGEGGIRTQS